MFSRARNSQADVSGSNAQHIKPKFDPLLTKNKSGLNSPLVLSPVKVADAESKPFLSRKELADRLQIGLSTLCERYNKNSLRYDPNFPVPLKLSPLGRKVVFSTADVNAWCNAVVNRSSSNSQVRGVK